MRPRADFECSKCAQAMGDSLVTEIVHEDLPIDCKFCPECGAKAGEGFERLFTAVNVNGGAGRVLDKVLTGRLEPLYEKHSTVKQGAANFDRAATEAMEKTMEKATPQERAQMQVMKGHVAPAGAVLGSLPATARQDSRECIFPAIKRTVRPRFER